MSDNNFCLNLIKEFCESDDLQNSISNLLNKICREYKFNKVTSFFNDRNSKEFTWRHTFIANKEKTAYTNVNNSESSVDIKNYTIRMSKRDFKREKMLYNLFENENTIYTQDVDYISEKLFMLNYEYPDIEIKELLLYAVLDDKDFIGYFVFEKYDSNLISQEELSKITIALDVVSMKIVEEEKFKEKDKQYEIKNAMSEASQLDRYVLVVEKDSFNIFYYENSVGNVLEKDGLNKKCYNVLANSNVPCVNCPIINNEIEKPVYSIRDDGDFFVRVGELSWRKENDSYIVSTMDASKAIANKLSNDILTNSLTWFGFKEKISEECSSDTKYVYISVDVEGMKIINDNNTQIVGNEILKQISISLKQFVNEDEYFCRVVADTYAIVIKYVDEKKLERRLEDLDIILSRMFHSIFSEITIIVTGGIYIIENDIVNNIDTCFENTRLARNNVKGSYKNTFIFYAESMREQLKDNKIIEDKIENAIINDEFLAYIQPKFELETMKVIGGEALVRWQSENEEDKEIDEYKEYSRDEIIIQNITNMANQLGFKVLCEGVETQEQVEFLKSIGCKYGQGYVFSRPIPITEFKEKFLK